MAGVGDGHWCDLITIGRSASPVEAGAAAVTSSATSLLSLQSALAVGVLFRRGKAVDSIFRGRCPVDCFLVT